MRRVMRRRERRGGPPYIMPFPLFSTVLLMPSPPTPFAMCAAAAAKLHKIPAYRKTRLWLAGRLTDCPASERVYLSEWSDAAVRRWSLAVRSLLSPTLTSYLPLCIGLNYRVVNSISQNLARHCLSVTMFQSS